MKALLASLVLLCSAGLDGNKITWTYKTDYNGQSISVAYDGTFDPTTPKITGTVNVPELSADGEFTATQPKDNQ